MSKKNYMDVHIRVYVCVCVREMCVCVYVILHSVVCSLALSSSKN